MSMRREIQTPGRRIKPSNSDLIVARNTSMHYDQITSSTLSTTPREKPGYFERRLGMWSSTSGADLFE